MTMKTPVTELQELCVKNQISHPYYQTIVDELGKTFVIQVEAFDQIAEGTGRSKKEAKHCAATNLIQLLSEMNLGVMNVPQLQNQIPVNGNAVGTLLDICVSRNLPIATFETISATGPSHAPEFLIECRVSSIVKIGKHSSKKGAKQIAAKLVLDELQEMTPNNLEEMVLVPLNEAMNTETDKVNSLFKTYRELKNSDMKKMPGVTLFDRHNFFKELDSNNVYNAKKILSESSDTDEERVFHLCKALGYSYEVTTVGTEAGNMKIFCLNSDFETIIMGTDDVIFGEVLDYFRVMLD